MKINTLMTVSFLSMMAVTVPAMADTNVLCSVRENYKNASVSADYKPGVDAKGKPVVSADVAAPSVNVPKTMTIPLTVDIAQRFNEVLPTASKLEAQVGTIEVQENGQVMINGKDMTGPADTMCSTVAKQKEAALKTADAPKKKKVVKKKKKVVAAPKAETAPVSEVQAEPATLAPSTPVEAAPAAAPVPAAAPQVLDAAPPSMPAAAPAAPAPAAPGVAPTPPASGAIVSPTEPAPAPAAAAPAPAPAPLDPLTGAPAPTPPAPAPINNNGTLSGGAQ